MDDGEDAHAVLGGDGDGGTGGEGVQDRRGPGDGEGDNAMEDERLAGTGVRLCALCLETLKTTLLCDTCKTRAYCSEECRKQDWTPDG